MTDQGRDHFFVRGDNLIVTPTRWSWERIVEFGFPAEKVLIVPHGVDTKVFTPLGSEEHAVNRTTLGIRENETVFVNAGGAFWNKGVDVLLQAFAKLRTSGRQVRLIVKDQRGLYGIPIEQVIQDVGKICPVLHHPDTLAAISVIRGNLNPSEVRALYGIADCYVSPCRAEGFNLPALEAIACGTPVIVTHGGATDDFCPDGVAWRIPGESRRMGDPASGLLGCYIEPDLDVLIDSMEDFASGRRFDKQRFADARQLVLEEFSWERAADALAKLATGSAEVCTPSVQAKATANPIFANVRAIHQEDVLDLISMIHPWSMSSTSKIRIGNQYDGGYVVPAIALDCDAVLSIGVGSDVSFDLQVAGRGAIVLQFDHTVEQSPTPHPNFTFYKLGWGIRSEGSYLSFADICAKMSGLQTKRPLLKFDVEGAEYDVFETVDPQDLAQFEVITCEIHDLEQLGSAKFFDKARRVLKTLTHYHAPVHLHANNYAGMALVKCLPIPRVLEISFLRRDLDSFPGLSMDPMPGFLDRPNHPFVPDIHWRCAAPRSR